MFYLDLTLPNPEENLALDEALLHMAEAGGQIECLRIWESTQYFVVLGKNCRVADDVQLDLCQSDGIPVLRRISGGGTVLIGPGCLNYSVVLRYDRAIGLDSITTSLGYCLDRVDSAIAACGLRVSRLGSDLIWEGRKFGGTAQRRQRSHFLHHGTILVRFDIPAVAKYLKEPRRQPAHRAGRDHSTFLTCLPVERDHLANCLREEWSAFEPLRSVPFHATSALVNSRYLNESG